MSDDSVDGFVVRVAFDADGPIVAVSGDLDVVTASTLGGALNGLIDDGYRAIVVDLAGLTFIDARGVRVLTDSARRIIGAGGTLTIQAVSAFTRRIFDITQLSELVILETKSVRATGLGSSEEAEVARLTQVAGANEDAQASPKHEFVRSSTDVIDAALRVVTSLADATVDNADGVSITLERHGRLMTVAASNDVVLTMDSHQYETGEGPCLDAKSQGRHFYIDSLAEETRWPRFVPLALDQGIHSILSSPLMTHDRPQGALNIYSSSEQAFGTRAQGLAALFAEQASEILTTAGHDVTDEASNLRFAASLAARRAIHQAQGVIMASELLTPDAAMRALFQQARAAGITVHAHAIAVVASLHPGDGHR
jgi:anti-anti-sigma factor